MFITKTAVNRPITTLMAVLALCLGGIITMFQLPVDKLPNSESSTITIFVGVRGGMPPEDIERLVTEPIEEAVATLSGLKSILSVAKKDKTNITLVFDETQNVKRATLEVSERLARIKGKLPKEIEKPIVARYNENDHPIVILTATSSVKTPEIIRSMIEKDLKPQLARVPGVANIDIGGGRQRKILVEFEKAKLEMHRIPILEVIRKLGANNISMMSGSYESDRDAWGVNIISQFKTLDDMRKMGIAVTKEGSRVRLGDVAVVRDYFLEPESYARVNNQPSVSVYVQKENAANTVTAAAGVMEVIREYEKTLSNDMGIGISIDQSVAIRQAISDVRGALTWGAFLTAFMLWFFLRRIKQVGVIVTSIPVAVLGTFFAMLLHATYMNKTGTGLPITINVMSLLGIALGIGRMVDDSIVVFDNVTQTYREALRRRPGEGRGPGPSINKLDLAVQATKEMAVPVASSTIIMIVIFLPIVFISADIRRLFADVAFTVIAALLASLVMAITVVPLLATRSLSDKDDKNNGQFEWEKKIEKGFAWIFSKLFRRGRPPSRPELRQESEKPPGFFKRNITDPLVELGGILYSPFKGKTIQGFVRWMTSVAVRYRLWVMLGILLSSALSVYLYIFHLEKEFIGDQEKKEFVIFVELPSGTKLDVSDKVVAAVENEINSLPEVKGVVKSVSARVEGWSSKIYVTLSPSVQRTRTVQDVIDSLRPKLKSIGAQYDAFIYFSEPSQAKEVIVDTFGKDYLTLREVAIGIAKKLQEVPGLRDVKLRYKPGRPEVRLRVDHARASLFGLNSKDIADSLHAQIRGLRATYYNAGSEQVETVGRLSEEDRRTWDKVSNLSLIAKNKKRNIVPIFQVVDYENSITPSEVWRKDKERVIQVSANRERMALSTAVDLSKKALKGMPVPIGYHYEFGGDYKKLMKSEKEFAYAFVIMLLLVYMVLACFFESYTQPFIMLLTIPLATAGSIPTLWLSKTPVNMGVYIGLLMLGGTVVSNAVILIDRLNMVKKSRGLLRSVLKVGLERSRPIFMTSLTTIAAMLPLCFSKGESADIWAPLALSVVSGIAVSSILTLFVIPAAYVVLELAMESWTGFFVGKLKIKQAIKKFFKPHFTALKERTSPYPIDTAK